MSDLAGGSTPVDVPKRRMSDEESSSGPHNEDNSIPAIKRRLVRPKKIRRPESLADSETSTPGAGPSSPPFRSRSRSQSYSAPAGITHRDELTAQTTNDLQTPKDQASILRRQPPPRSSYTPHRAAHPPLTPSRSVYSYTRLNHIEEGTYGVVFRARCNDTGGIYALKKLKLEEEKGGFPITSLREVMALMVAGKHENVVGVREVVVGETLNQ
jgi:cell division cycle 2-like protein